MQLKLSAAQGANELERAHQQRSGGTSSVHVEERAGEVVVERALAQRVARLRDEVAVGAEPSSTLMTAMLLKAARAAQCGIVLRGER